MSFTVQFCHSDDHRKTCIDIVLGDESVSDNVEFQLFGKAISKISFYLRCNSWQELYTQFFEIEEIRKKLKKKMKCEVTVDNIIHTTFM